MRALLLLSAALLLAITLGDACASKRRPPLKPGAWYVTTRSLR